MLSLKYDPESFISKLEMATPPGWVVQITVIVYMNYFECSKSGIEMLNIIIIQAKNTRVATLAVLLGHLD